MSQQPIFSAYRGEANTSAVERYFEISLYLLILTGFVTLTATGRLDLLSMVVVSLALLVRGYFLLIRYAQQIPEKWTTYLTLAYVVFYALDFFFISGSFVTASVHLVLFSMVIKIFSVHRDRDLLYLAVLAFLMVLAAAVLTVDSVFFVAFSVFLVVAISTFMSFEMHRTAAAATRRAEAPVPYRKLERSLTSTALGLMLAILLGAAVVFFVLPRATAGYLSSFAPHNTFTTGFGSSVNLGEIGEIQQLSAVVMHVHLEGELSRVADLKWRGNSLSLFDGRRWYNPMVRINTARALDGRYELAQFQPIWLGTIPPRPDAHYRPLTYRILMEPIGTNVFFLAPETQLLLADVREVLSDSSGTVYNNDGRRSISAYQGDANIPVIPWEEMKAASGPVPPMIAIRYLQLPRVDPRVRQLAHDVTANAASPAEKALAIESHLRTKYGYTLRLPSVRPEDPIANFLFERKEGHCEYFASAMAIMLRTQGIPSRIVTGFRNGEFNDLTGGFVVRARDAHSWVEVWFSGIGWVPFDPTPASPEAMTVSSRWRLYLDAMGEFWREWVVNYDFGHQRTLAVQSSSGARETFDNFRLRLRRYYDSLLERARGTRDRMTASPKKWSGWAVVIVAVVLILPNSRRLYRLWHDRRLAEHPESAPQQAAAVWYTRMTKTMSRRGFRKLPSHTPQEFVATIENGPMREMVERFTDHYRRARFGDSPTDAAKLPEIYEELKANGK